MTMPVTPTTIGAMTQRPPVAEPEILQQEERDEGAHHVLGAVREVDDVEHAEDHGEPEAEQRVERAVDQPEQQLPEQRLRGDAEDFEHGMLDLVPRRSARSCERSEVG